MYEILLSLSKLRKIKDTLTCMLLNMYPDKSCNFTEKKRALCIKV